MGNIVWLASYPKSGNTWLRAFLANLVANRAAPLTLAELPNYALLEAEPALYGQVAGRASTTLGFDDICALRPQVHAMIAAASRGTVFVKTHSIAAAYAGVPQITPQVTAGAIAVVRNPLDVVVSMAHHFGISIDDAITYLGDPRAATANSELFVAEFLGSWSQHVRSWADQAGPRVLVLRYEELLETPEAGFGAVARLVGLGADSERVTRAIAHARFDALAALEKRDGFVEAAATDRRFFRSGRADEWREVLTRAQVQRVIVDHREQMQRFDYVPAGF
jgi:hypothetical protein